MPYSQLAFVIPFRKDSFERLENLEAVLTYFSRRFAGAEIVVTECGETRAAEAAAKRHAAHYLFESSAGVFHRTRSINSAVLGLISARYVAISDADALPFGTCLDAALDALKAGGGAALAHNGKFYDVRGEVRQALIKSSEPESVSYNEAETGRAQPGVVCVNANSVGGIVLFERGAFIACGGYNENFISWGWEDTEIKERFSKLGRPMWQQACLPLLHLTHPRGPDSHAGNLYFMHNWREYRRMSALSPDQVKAEIDRGGLRRNEVPGVGVADRLLSAVRCRIFALRQNNAG